jgi:hypothetical protein
MSLIRAASVAQISVVYYVTFDPLPIDEEEANGLRSYGVLCFVIVCNYYFVVFLRGQRRPRHVTIPSYRCRIYFTPMKFMIDTMLPVKP